MTLSHRTLSLTRSHSIPLSIFIVITQFNFFPWFMYKFIEINISYHIQTFVDLNLPWFLGDGSLQNYHGSWQNYHVYVTYMFSYHDFQDDVSISWFLAKLPCLHFLSVISKMMCQICKIYHCYCKNYHASLTCICFYHITTWLIKSIEFTMIVWNFFMIPIAHVFYHNYFAHTNQSVYKVTILPRFYINALYLSCSSKLDLTCYK